MKRNLLLLALFLLASFTFVTVMGIKTQEQFDALEQYNLSRLWTPPVSTYKVSRITTNFQPMWTSSDVFIYDSNFMSNLVAFDGNLYFAGSLNQYAYPALYALDADNGNLEWQSDEIEGQMILNHNRTYLFVGSGVYGMITAYDSTTGNKVWERSLPRTRGVEYILPTTTNLFVNSVPVKFHILDINSGRIEENTFTTDAFPIFYETSGVIYAQSRSNQLQAIDGQRGTLIWEANLPEGYIQPPLFTDDIILLTTGERTFGKVCALERTSGWLLWCSELDTASNVAVAGGTAYYLTLDSQLKAVAPQTGELIGEITFTPSLMALDDWDLSNRKFYIAADEGFVFVYFGSGRQLFAFQFSSPLDN